MSNTIEIIDQLTGELFDVPVMIDPEVSGVTGRSMNDDLQSLRNQHPFVQIDPPFSNNCVCYRIASGDPVINVNIPSEAQMFRVTWATSGATSFLYMSPVAVDPSGSAGYPQIANPTPIWRACHGLRQLSFDSNGGAAVLYFSVEFWMQL